MKRICCRGSLSSADEEDPGLSGRTRSAIIKHDLLHVDKINSLHTAGTKQLRIERTGYIKKNTQK